MMYKTELHTHSSSVSRCSGVTEEQIVEEYVKAGYTTVLLTNHLSKFTYKYHDIDISSMSWDEKVDYYMAGFHRIEEAAKGKINVLMGVELRSNKDDNDYLIHGIDEAFLRAHPTIMDTKVSEVANDVRAYGGLFYQAHPFRNGMKIQKPEILDGIEVYNGHIGHDSRNNIAYMWAQKFGLKMISGTDYHQLEHIIGAGIMTETPITTEKELLDYLKNGNYKLIREGGVSC